MRPQQQRLGSNIRGIVLSPDFVSEHSGQLALRLHRSGHLLLSPLHVEHWKPVHLVCAARLAARDCEGDDDQEEGTPADGAPQDDAERESRAGDDAGAGGVERRAAQETGGHTPQSGSSVLCSCTLHGNWLAGHCPWSWNSDKSCSRLCCLWRRVPVVASHPAAQRQTFAASRAATSMQSQMRLLGKNCSRGLRERKGESVRGRIKREGVLGCRLVIWKRAPVCAHPQPATVTLAMDGMRNRVSEPNSRKETCRKETAR